MAHARLSWREACDSALQESDPKKLLGCIEYAITTLERRYAEWDTDPGTAAELNAIRKTILALERHIRKRLGYGADPPKATEGTSDATEHSVASGLGQVRRLFRVLRS